MKSEQADQQLIAVTTAAVPSKRSPWRMALSLLVQTLLQRV